MKPDISEFSYGYALTEDLIRLISSPLHAAPLFPTLSAEGGAGGGYDLKLKFGIPLFLQFKRSEFMNWGKIERDSGIFSSQFYRIPLFPINPDREYNQHDLLLDLEKDNPLVFYAAPIFHTIEQFDRFYLAHDIACNSIFIRPSSIGHMLPRKKYHVAFKVLHPHPLNVEAYRLPDPVQVNVHLCEAILKEIRVSIKNSLHISALFEKMLVILRKRQLVSEIVYRFSNKPFAAVAYLARVYFQAEMLWISRPSE